MSIPYDLLDVIWGDETLRARPISWNKDLTAEDINLEEAEDIYVTAYELVCPACGGRCEFKTSDSPIICEGCGSETENPLCETNEEEIEEIEEIEDVSEDLANDIKKIREDLNKPDKPSTPEDILDNLTASITNAEILLEPDEEDKKEVEKSKQSTKKKTKTKAKKK